MGNDTLAASAAQANEPSGDPSTLEGTINAGTYDPLGFFDGEAALPTVEVTIGEEYASSTNASTAVVRRAVLATTQIGDQYGPTGGERVTLTRSRSYWVAHLLHGPDDTPKANPGERVMGVRNPTTGQYTGFVKLLQDGAAPGDGLGGFATTQPYNALGGEFHSLTAGEAAYVKAHIETMVSNVISQTLQSLMTELAGALVTASAGTSTPTQQAIALQVIIAAAGWVVSNVTPPTLPDGCPGVRLSNL